MPEPGARPPFAQWPPVLAGAPREPARAALAGSAAVHALILAASFLAVSHVAGPLAERAGDPLLNAMVWIASPGPGGGGGGGGNRMQEPAPRLAVRGRDQASMPALTTPAQAAPADVPPDAPALDQQIVVPVQFAGASLDTRPGVLDGLEGSGPSRGPGSGPGAGSGRGSGAGPGDGPGIGDGRGGGTGGDVYRLGAGIEPPEPLRKVKPLYTNEAMRLKIQGTAWIECVVLADGAVANPRIVRSLDSMYGLDEEALKAVRKWRFRPGRRAGQPVAVLVTIAMDFNLF